MFKVGDVVELKSGSVPMTVSNIQNNNIRVIWYCNAHYQLKNAEFEWMDHEMFKSVETT